MNKIDITNWEEYNIADLFVFEKIKGDIQAPKTNDGPYPLVSSGMLNNGICKYIEEQPASNKFDENKITVDMFGKCFFQSQKFYSVAHARVNVLTPKFNLNKYSGFFIASVIESITLPKYQFNDMCSQKALKNEKIKLPSIYNSKTNKYEPDLHYMENYMKNVETKVRDSLTKLKSAKENKHKINITNWKKFKMSDLGFTNYHGKRIKKQDRKDGNIVFITAGKENQGIAGKIGNDITPWINPITVDMFGNCFYHNFECFGDDNIYAFINDKLNDYHKWFIASIINVENSVLFSYGDQFRQDNANELFVLLPIDKNGDPDWNYMENYMKNVEEKTKEKLFLL